MIFIPDIPVIVLQLPLIVTLIAVFRYVIGMKTWKNYPTIALSLAYYLVYQTTGSALFTMLFWSTSTLFIIGSAIGARYLIRKLKINYYARVAVMYLAATVGMLVILGLAIQTPAKTFITQPSFGIAVFLIGTTIDELATLLFKKDMQEFIRRFISTIGIALISGLLLTWSWWNSFFGRHQEILVGVLAVDFVIAFWTVIRLTEIVRFGSIIKNQK